MWQRVKDELAELMASQIFKVLLGNPEYQLFLNRAGLSGKLPSKLELVSKEKRQAISEMALMHATLLVNQLSDLNAVRAHRAKALLLEGPLQLYRLWNSAYPRSKNGFWWFSQGLLDRSASAGPNPADRLHWLRDKLAISMDWSACDRVSVLRLQVNDVVPAIQAWGLPQRYYSKEAWRTIEPKEYFSKISEEFAGGATQTFLPWVPEQRVSDFW
ncbi:MAG: hypothetical protein NZV14_13650 [Bryobacteraceae bacterium]|nr:hypothetical protein [Bryobacteraceae bacterium]MDW8379203.1 hypothetical protein [Bryobacterales bacterium]